MSSVGAIHGLRARQVVLDADPKQQAGQARTVWRPLPGNESWSRVSVRECRVVSDEAVRSATAIGGLPLREVAPGWGWGAVRSVTPTARAYGCSFGQIPNEEVVGMGSSGVSFGYGHCVTRPGASSDAASGFGLDVGPIALLSEAAALIPNEVTVGTAQDGGGRSVSSDHHRARRKTTSCDPAGRWSR